MMTHLEGPIVDSFYDMSLCSWHNELKPPLPSYNSPAAMGGLPSFKEKSHEQMFSRQRSPQGFNQGGEVVEEAMNGQQTSVLANGDVMRKAVGNEGEDQSSGGGARDLAGLTHDGSRETLPEHTSTDSHYDPDIASEATRAQSVLSPRGSESRMKAVTRHLSRLHRL